MNGIEIEIRQSNKIIPVRSRSVNRMSDYGKKIKIEEKFKTSESYWDYSNLHGKKFFVDVS
jgi:hypothetical protein